MSADPNDERAEIVAFMVAVLPADVVVNDRERTSLVSYVNNDGVLHGYGVTNADPSGANSEMRTPQDTGSYRVHRTWTIRGFHQVDDSDGSEKIFRKELADIMDALSPHRSLGHTVLATRFPSLEKFTPLEGEGFVFHYAEIVFGTSSEGFYDPD